MKSSVVRAHDPDENTWMKEQNYEGPSSMWEWSVLNLSPSSVPLWISDPMRHIPNLLRPYQKQTFPCLASDRLNHTHKAAASLYSRQTQKASKSRNPSRQNVGRVERSQRNEKPRELSQVSSSPSSHRAISHSPSQTTYGNIWPS